MNEPPLPPGPHFGTDEEMLARCAREGITPLRDARGDWDWLAVWDAYMRSAGDAAGN